jgi:adenylosuccinate lyase
MSLTPLTALSPVDGRYAARCADLREIFSEQGLIHARVRVEIAWLHALAGERRIAELQGITAADLAVAQQVAEEFSDADAKAVKAFERETNHDVKAVEYLIKQKLGAHPAWQSRLEFVHFACTSEDINNLSYALMCQRGARKGAAAAHRRAARRAALDGARARGGRDDVAHARPGGHADHARQGGRRLRAPPAGGARHVRWVPIRGKINGAVGNYNAHVAAYPTSTGRRSASAWSSRWACRGTRTRRRSSRTTGCRVLRRARALQFDPDRPVPRLLGLRVAGLLPPESRGRRSRFFDDAAQGQPHRLRERRRQFRRRQCAAALHGREAAGLALAARPHRLDRAAQHRRCARALADIAIQSVSRGLARLEVDRTRLAADLAANWELLAEPIQTVMRRYAVPEAYEQLKALTRGRRIDGEAVAKFVDGLAIPAAEKATAQSS